MSVRSLLAVAVLCLVASVSAEAAGDPVQGKALGYTCLGCHGIENYKSVYPTFAVPRLRGQHPDYIVAALKGYKKGERNHATMHAHASSMSDQDMENVAAYLAGTPVASVANAKPVGAVPPVVETLCKTCHGLDGVGIAGTGAPTLSGQHVDYLEHALAGYRSGARKNGLMKPFADQLKPEEVEVVAEYYGRQQPKLVTVPRKEKPAKK